jgi:hypothetical protein
VEAGDAEDGGEDAVEFALEVGGGSISEVVEVDGDDGGFFAGGVEEALGGGPIEGVVAWAELAGGAGEGFEESVDGFASEGLLAGEVEWGEIGRGDPVDLVKGERHEGLEPIVALDSALFAPGGEKLCAGLVAGDFAECFADAIGIGYGAGVAVGVDEDEAMWFIEGEGLGEVIEGAGVVFLDVDVEEGWSGVE